MRPEPAAPCLAASTHQSFAFARALHRPAVSTTSDLRVAVEYATSGMPLLLKIATTGFIDRGADLAWCSCFPDEAEYLFPPLAYLKPTDRREEVCEDGQSILVIEVTPYI